MKKATLLLLLTALFPVSACDLSEVDASDLGRELRDVLVELREVGADMRDELVDAAEEARAEFDAALEELEQELANNQELREELEAKQEQLRELIRRAKEEGAAAWEGTRDALLAVLAELDRMLDEVRDRAR